MAQSVYAFKYDYTDNDGIKSKESGLINQVYFVTIQNNCLGIHSYSNADIYDKWDNLCQEAINNLSKNYRLSRQSPSNIMDVYFLVRYCSEYSTSYKTTYRSCGAKPQVTVSNYGYYGGRLTGQWENEVWRSNCYTLNNDKSQLILWQVPGGTVGYFDSYFNSSGGDYSTKRYYTRITRSSLRPNTDFLYE